MYLTFKCTEGEFDFFCSYPLYLCTKLCRMRKFVDEQILCELKNRTNTGRTNNEKSSKISTDSSVPTINTSQSKI